MTRKPFWGDCCLPQVYEGGVTLTEIWDAMEAASDTGAYMEAHVIAYRYGLEWMCPVCVERTVNPLRHKIPVPSSALEFALLLLYWKKRYLWVCVDCHVDYEAKQRPRAWCVGINTTHSRRSQAVPIIQTAIAQTTPVATDTRGR